ncbi:MULTISPECIES: class I SAM-dependent methyltransferase [unclassified Arsukibacterium]|uniref:class I SAM-dependent methyltransferase n=1 Tax=unclassified Arsukibacterium TaxID=2635278 RepID=UPI000C920449|nr:MULTISPECIES: class I SAM-dependent methyltransferase [unclassified Arsukibacterium]MAA96315.1 methyltransferase [Rheinheimera sp.]|tara:strand:- start:192 stop:1085 length:894 start_codon:yes stop_codon:yes gene_type:complete
MKNNCDYSLQPHEKYGFLQVKPTPSVEEINRFYANEFYSGDYKNFNNSSLDVQLADQKFWEGTWNDQAKVIQEQLARPFADLEILDVGCGWAQALLHFKRLGASCYGFDPAIEAVEYGISQDLNIKHCGVESMDVFGGKKFDVVMLNNVLEHLAEPVSVMTEIRQSVLKDGGLLIVTVPNEFNKFQVAAQRLYDLEPWWVTPPAHLNYFSKSSLQAMLSGCGFHSELAVASFPLELFLLMGDNYVNDRDIGKACHAKRVQFELNLRQLGEDDTILQFYRALADANLGRQITCYAKAI